MSDRRFEPFFWRRIAKDRRVRAWERRFHRGALRILWIPVEEFRRRRVAFP